MERQAGDAQPGDEGWRTRSTEHTAHAKALWLVTTASLRSRVTVIPIVPRVPIETIVAAGTHPTPAVDTPGSDEQRQHHQESAHRNKRRKKVRQAEAVRQRELVVVQFESRASRVWHGN
jgi:hypothetical protein